MPRATAKYRFEWKMFSWAGHLSEVMSGENRCFLMVADDKGTVRELLIGEDEYHYDKEVWGKLMESSCCWLFYHPFDGPVYTFMCWEGIGRSTMERLMGEPFEENDFSEGIPGAPPIEGEGIEFPTSWSVMF